MSREDIKIIGGNEVKVDLKPEELDELVDVWFQEMDKLVDTPISEIRQLVDNVLERVSEESKLIEAQQKRERRVHLIEDLREAINRGDMTIVRKNGKVAGMVRVVALQDELHWITREDAIEGRVFEIGKALTIPEAQGEGIYGMVNEQAIANLRKKYGDVSILAGTKNDIIKKMYRKDGWREIGFEGYLRIYGDSEAYIASRKDKDNKNGWTAFLYIGKLHRMVHGEGRAVPWDGKPV